MFVSAWFVFCSHMLFQFFYWNIECAAFLCSQSGVAKNMSHIIWAILYDHILWRCLLRQPSRIKLTLGYSQVTIPVILCSLNSFFSVSRGIGFSMVATFTEVRFVSVILWNYFFMEPARMVRTSVFWYGPLTSIDSAKRFGDCAKYYLYQNFFSWKSIWRMHMLKYTCNIITITFTFDSSYIFIHP